MPMVYRTPPITLHLEPEVIRSIVESSGMDHATIAQKLKVDRPLVDGWVRTGVIEYAEVRALAGCVKRSETVFLRTVPLKSEEVPDYRMSGDAPRSLAVDDRPVVRQARYRQSAARDMMGAQGIATEPQIPKGVTVEASAGEIADRERIRLEVDIRKDGPLKGSMDEIYRSLRTAIEGANILVFQHSLETKGVRGLSLTSSVPCTILVNSQEIAPAKSFTLLHEYAHILLGKGGVCDEHGTVRSDSDQKRVEAWCNRFAASFLMPKEAFAIEFERLGERLDSPLEVVENLAKKFKTSKYAAAVRTVNMAGNSAKSRYGGALDIIAGSYSLKQKIEDEDEDEKAALPPASTFPHTNVLISQLGKKFIKLTLLSHERKIITSRDLEDYLGMNIAHLDKLREKVPLGG